MRKLDAEGGCQGVAMQLLGLFGMVDRLSHTSDCSKKNLAKSSLFEILKNLNAKYVQ